MNNSLTTSETHTHTLTYDTHPAARSISTRRIYDANTAARPSHPYTTHPQCKHHRFDLVFTRHNSGRRLLGSVLMGVCRPAALPCASFRTSLVRFRVCFRVRFRVRFCFGPSRAYTQHNTTQHNATQLTILTDTPANRVAMPDADHGSWCVTAFLYSYAHCYPRCYPHCVRDTRTRGAGNTSIIT